MSLLWPAGTHPSQASTALDPLSVRDLGLDHTLAALSSNGLIQSKIREIFLTLCTDLAVIAYRQDILEDLWNNPALIQRLEQLLPHICALESYRASIDPRRATLHDVAWRLGELEQWVSCVSGLSDVFAQVGDNLRAAGWRTLRDWVTQTVQDEVYQNLTRELPDMLQRIRSKVSVTIGVNLDGRLRPIAATLLSVNERKFVSSSFLDRLLGRRGDDFTGLGPLHTVPELEPGVGAGGRRQEVNPLMVPLFYDVAQVLDTVCRPIAKALGQYGTIQSHGLATLSADLTFYLSAVRLMQRLRDHGLPVCRPNLAPMTERLCELSQAYNPNLALHLMGHHANVDERIVENDVHMGKHGRIGILTGPNQGGKTTYTQMVGLCHILAQAGLWVPAAQARLSPVDNIYTHYPSEEKLEQATGRFGDEAQRLGYIFAQATRHSLILLNESLSSTSPGESLYIALDIARILRRMGTRALFSTHLHELAAEVSTLNRTTPGDSLLVSLVASRLDAEDDGMQRSYRIVPGAPLGHSYAREVAAKYGISYDQLAELLQRRGVLSE